MQLMYSVPIAVFCMVMVGAVLAFLWAVVRLFSFFMTLLTSSRNHQDSTEGRS